MPDFNDLEDQIGDLIAAMQELEDAFGTTAGNISGGETGDAGGGRGGTRGGRRGGPRGAGFLRGLGSAALQGGLQGVGAGGDGFGLAGASVAATQFLGGIPILSQLTGLGRVSQLQQRVLGGAGQFAENLARQGIDLPDDVLQQQIDFELQREQRALDARQRVTDKLAVNKDFGEEIENSPLGKSLTSLAENLGKLSEAANRLIAKFGG